MEHFVRGTAGAIWWKVQQESKQVELSYFSRGNTGCLNVSYENELVDFDSELKDSAMGALCKSYCLHKVTISNQ